MKFKSFQHTQLSNNKKILMNWSGACALASVNQIRTPKKESDLIKLLLKNNKIRPLGSGLTYEPVSSIYEENGEAILVDLKNKKGIVRYTEHTVTFRGATLLDDVYLVLVKMNRMLPVSPGVIGIQTLAGALSTGTHGQGKGHSFLGDAVSELRIMLADSTVITIDRKHPYFNAFILSLGALGIILDVTLSTVPLEIYECVKFTTNEHYFFDNYLKLNYLNHSVKAWWFPWSEESLIWVINEAVYDKKQNYLSSGCMPLVLKVEREISLDASIDSALERMKRDTQAEIDAARHFETVIRFRSQDSVIGNIYQLMCKGIPVPQINCEIAVPANKFSKAIDLLKSWHKNQTETMHYPFIFRYCGQSSAWLSPGSNGDVCWIGFLVYLTPDGQFASGSLEWMKEIQLLLASIGGIPHFGKHFCSELYEFSKALPKWNEFVELKNRLDPDQRFENKFLMSLFHQNL